MTSSLACDEEIAAYQPCPCCGAAASDRDASPVLWQKLIDEWRLSESEAAIIDAREGSGCSRCGVRLRSAALARMILQAIGWAGTFDEWLATRPTLRVLEINEAGQLAPLLRRLENHLLIEYPEFDMHATGLPAGEWDLVVHSDTIEHVTDPVRAFAECRRLLAVGGVMCFTAPVVPGRLTIRRDPAEPSYHGQSHDLAYLVVTEYGADFWTQLFAAGFRSIEMSAHQWPEAFAFAARLNGNTRPPGQKNRKPLSKLWRALYARR